MTPEEQSQIMVQATRLNIAVTPVQVGDEIRVLVQIADIAGLSFTMSLTQDAARAISRAIKQGIEAAEVQIVKPQSAIASA
jgi:hypothetical protein